MSTLYFKKPNGRYEVASEEQIVFHYQYLNDLKFVGADALVMSSPVISRPYMYMRTTFDHENFVVMFLDTKHRVLACKEMFRGTIDQCSVPIREIIKEALKYNASALICAHGHPSGEPVPSSADKSLTETLYLASRMVGIKLLDHFIFGRGGPENGVSLAEQGGIG